MKKCSFVIIAAFFIFTLTGCTDTDENSLYIPADSSVYSDAVYDEHILTANVDSLEKAELIAEKCNIVLEKWEAGHALYYSDENLDTVIQRAENLGISELEKSVKMEFYG